MKAVSVDDTNRLWAISDLLETEQVKYIINLPWDEFPWSRNTLQDEWLRRRIHSEHPEVQLVSTWIDDKLKDINLSIGTNFTRSHGIWWLDEPGFSCPMHTDGHLPNSMQIYWLAANEDLGTSFYHHKIQHKEYLRQMFPSKTNSGYLMLNHREIDGSQPLQWHGMFNRVPENTYRLSSYWYFE